MSPAFIDIYSDTKSMPTDGMRAAIASAIVGDEQKDEDPTTLELCRRVADLLGKEAAVLLPSGTMANEIALQVHCRPGDEVICDKLAHLMNFEGGAPAAYAGVMMHPLDGKDGIYDAKQLSTALSRPQSRYYPRMRLLWVEQTAAMAGGTVWPLSTIEEVTTMAHEKGLATHMDGARLMNAVIASGVPAKAYSQYFDSVWIDLSKGLGCPIGAVLAGSHEFIQQAWRIKQRMGGSFRQSGFIAAAGIYALDHNVERMAEDHENAKFLAGGLAEIPGVHVPQKTVATNIVLFDVTGTGHSPEDAVRILKYNGVGVGAFGKVIRAVIFIGISREDIVTALGAVRRALKSR